MDNLSKAKKDDDIMCSICQKYYPKKNMYRIFNYAGGIYFATCNKCGLHDYERLAVEIDLSYLELEHACVVEVWDGEHIENCSEEQFRKIVNEMADELDKIAEDFGGELAELSIEEDSIEEDSIDEDSVDEDSIEEDSVDEDSVDEDSVDEDSIDLDSIDEHSLKKCVLWALETPITSLHEAACDIRWLPEEYEPKKNPYKSVYDILMCTQIAIERLPRYNPDNFELTYRDWLKYQW